MKLTIIKKKLSNLENTDIGQVIFDQNKYAANTGHLEKTYPLIVWCFNHTDFIENYTENIIQIVDKRTIPVFIVGYFDVFTENEDRRLEVWDELRASFKAYINEINKDLHVKVANINKLKGTLIPEGTRDQNKEIAIMYENVELEFTCNE